MARRRVTSGTARTWLMAAAASVVEPGGKVRVRRPRLNSALGGTGRPATAARTLASTMAWRKSGTGCVFEPREMRRESSALRVTLALMVLDGGAAGVAVCVGRVGEGRGAERGSGPVGAAFAAGGAVRGRAAAAAGGAGAAVSGTVVQAERAEIDKAANMRVLPAMRVSLSCARCFDHR